MFEFSISILCLLCLTRSIMFCYPSVSSFISGVFVTRLQFVISFGAQLVKWVLYMAKSNIFHHLPDKAFRIAIFFCSIPTKPSCVRINGCLVYYAVLKIEWVLFSYHGHTNSLCWTPWVLLICVFWWRSLWVFRFFAYISSCTACVRPLARRYFGK